MGSRNSSDGHGMQSYSDQPILVVLDGISDEESQTLWERGRSDASDGKPCNLWQIWNEGYGLRERHDWGINETTEWVQARQGIYELGYDSYHEEKSGFPLSPSLKEYVRVIET